MERVTEKKRLAIVGGYPPPFGGVSTHLMRLRFHLDAAGLDYVIFNTVSAGAEGDRVLSVRAWRRFWMLRYTLFGKDASVYLVSARTVNWLCGAFMHSWRGKRVAIRLQNAKVLDLVQSGGWRRRLLALVLKRVDHIVCVNQELALAVLRLGVKPVAVSTFPGFLPPSAAERDPELVSDRVWDFCRGKFPIIAANGRVASWKGEDLYGLDHLVCLAQRLKPEFPSLGIVVCFWELLPEDQPVLQQLLAAAEAKKVQGNIFFNTEKGPFLPVLERAQLFLRPTNTDGDANSIREALYLGKPVVASDVVERPVGSILFRTRDLDDLTEKTRSVLRTVPRSPAPPSEGAEEAAHRLRCYLLFLAQLSGQRLADRQAGHRGGS